ncbi:putative oxidoreductase [alpha proteobacterium BAL199]|jgi:nitronate monooxygenase|nr:putative oxidoreductase [alpha proteobacterium BAL199]
MTLRTPLTELLGIEHPILSAPMAGVAGGALAGAVSQAGGLGLVGGGYIDPDWIEREWAALGNARAGIGFITWRLAEQPAVLEAALARRPAAMMLSFGDPAPYLGRIRDAGVLAICQVQTVADAKRAADAGAQIIVAQGADAGGHGASRGTFALVPAVVDAVPAVPVVAAGGVGDGRGLAAALSMGASGVLVGSRFYATSEAQARPEAKQRAVEASGDQTIQSSVYDRARGYAWPSAFRLRTLRNRFTERWHGREEAMLETLDEVLAGFGRAVETGDLDEAPVVVGEATDLIRDVPLAGDLVRRMVQEAEMALRHGVRCIEQEET